jgi:hypothetical protein
MVMSPAVLEPEKDCTGEPSSKSNLQYRALVREEVPRQQILNCIKII